MPALIELAPCGAARLLYAADAATDVKLAVAAETSISTIELMLRSLEGESLQEALQQLAAGVGDQQRAQQIFAAFSQYQSDLTKAAGTESGMHEWKRRAENLAAELASTSAALKQVSAELHQMRSSTLWRVGSNIHHITDAARSVAGLLRPRKLKPLATAAQSEPATTVPAEPVEAVPAPEPRAAFVFTPGGKLEDGLLAHQQGQYSIAPEPRGYIYIPPRRPEALGEELARLKVQFSVVVPVFNTPASVFRSMVHSVQTQWYPYWELIVVDDGSSSPMTRDCLRAVRGTDPRITVLSLPRNKGISTATNEGLTAARGEYVVFLDHDDELTEDCLFELAQAIDRDHPDYLYSDEDKIASSGELIHPFFKPDWSPDTLMSTMYTSHVSCVRRELLSQVGYLRPEFDGSQDWDLVLRVTERAKKITHIPRILYHWRADGDSVAAIREAKPYAIEAGQRARVEALQRRGLIGTLHPLKGMPAYSRVRYKVQGSPLVSVIIPSKNNGAVLRCCIDSICNRTGYPHYEIVVLDNGSTEESTVAYLNELSTRPNVSVLRDESPFNWSALNNNAVRHSSGDVLLFLNDDTEVIALEWMEEMLGYAQLPHIGAVGARLLYPPGDRLQHIGVVNLFYGPSHGLRFAALTRPDPFCRNVLDFNYIAVTGACLMIERKKFELVGSFDETFVVAYNDVEFCFRAVKRGFYHVVCHGAELLHHESLSRGDDFEDPAKLRRMRGEVKRLYVTHPEFYLTDPFSNPHLHPNDVNYGVPQ